MIALLLSLALQAGTPAPPPPAPASVAAPGMPGATLTLTVVEANSPAILTLRRPDARDEQAAIGSVGAALLLLADPRLAPLWPALTDWAGPGLERLRDARLRSVRALVADGSTRVATTTSASSVRPRVRAALLLSEGLWAAGQREAAEKVVADARGAQPGKGDWGLAEWTMTSLRLANLRAERGDTAGALAMLDASAAPLGAAPYAINLRVNRAVYLLEARRDAEALAEIEGAMATFGLAPDGRAFRGGEKVPGSERQFAWIRACALARLGRAPEARAMAAVLGTAVEPRDGWFVVEPTRALRHRYARCTDDAAMAARLYAEELAAAPIGGGALVELQPGFASPRFDRGFAARVRADPVLAPLLASRMRTLPDAFVPALNGWSARSN